MYLSPRLPVRLICSRVCVHVCVCVCVRCGAGLACWWPARWRCCELSHGVLGVCLPLCACVCVCVRVHRYMIHLWSASPRLQACAERITELVHPPTGRPHHARNHIGCCLLPYGSLTQCLPACLCACPVPCLSVCLCVYRRSSSHIVRCTVTTHSSWLSVCVSLTSLLVHAMHGWMDAAAAAHLYDATDRTHTHSGVHPSL
mmetsp:Transcript_44218/g.125099  ORF Transcript_44218/g.125099 Transcript_44218/m.125099 type:complete len:201 (-) Transcript_44218:27-629(-)